MRLWIYELIPYLPKSQLLGQHRECCAMRGLGWGRKHYTVNYVFNYNYLTLFYYHTLIMNEMKKKNYNIDLKWYDANYRGKKLGYQQISELPSNQTFTDIFYSEHNDEYLSICLHNLKYSISNATGEPKGIDLFNHFPEIKDLGYSLDDYEKGIRTKLNVKIFDF